MKLGSLLKKWRNPRSGNKYRNELGIFLNGKSYVLRPTFAVMVELETSFGMNLISLMGHISDSKLTFAGAKKIIAAGLKGADQQITETELEEGLMQLGLANIGKMVVDFLSLAIFGGESIKKN